MKNKFTKMILGCAVATILLGAVSGATTIVVTHMIMIIQEYMESGLLHMLRLAMLLLGLESLLQMEQLVMIHIKDISHLVLMQLLLTLQGHLLELLVIFSIND